MRNPFKTSGDILKEYLAFNRRERNGMIALLCILIMICIILYVINSRKTKSYTLNPEEISTIISRYESWKRTNVELYQAYDHKENQYANLSVLPKNENILQLFNFNPNMASDETFSQLGFKKHEIRSIRKYLSKAGKYKTKDAFLRMYFMDESRDNMFRSFIQLPDFDSIIASNDNKIKIDNYIEHQVTPIDINLASEMQLTKLKGIGAARAKAIIRYREKLGGYINSNQLYEVSYMDSSIIEAIIPHLIFRDVPLRLIKVNQHQYQELLHPYLSKSLAEMIVNYRKFHGSFKTKEEFRKMTLLDEELYSKIAPYISLETEKLSTNAE